MKKLVAVLFIMSVIWGCSSSTSPESIIDNNCIESRIFFGLSSPAGEITDEQWQSFMTNEIASRFPSGFTIIDAIGYWRECDTCQFYQEKSKMMLLVYPDSLFKKNIPIIEDMAYKYIEKFNQQAVLQSSTEVNCEFYFKK